MLQIPQEKSTKISQFATVVHSPVSRAKAVFQCLLVQFLV